MTPRLVAVVAVALVGALALALAPGGPFTGRAGAASSARQSETIWTCHHNLATQDAAGSWQWSSYVPPHPWWQFWAAGDPDCNYSHSRNYFWLSPGGTAHYYQGTITYLFTDLDRNSRYQVYVSYGTFPDFYGGADRRTCWFPQFDCSSESVDGFVSAHENPTSLYEKTVTSNPVDHQNGQLDLGAAIVPGSDGAKGAIVNLTLTVTSGIPTANSEIAYAPQKAWVVAVGPANPTPPASVPPTGGHIGGGGGPTKMSSTLSSVPPVSPPTTRPPRRGPVWFAPTSPSGGTTGGSTSPGRSGGGGRQSLH